MCGRFVTYLFLNNSFRAESECTDFEVVDVSSVCRFTAWLGQYDSMLVEEFVRVADAL